MNNTPVDTLVNRYELLPHPEGGYYKETYRSETILKKNALPEFFGGDRNCSTAIYFLLDRGNFSAFHRIKSDECWHFYTGDCLHIYVITPGGEMYIIKLGGNVEAGEQLQAVVPAGCWFASQPMGAFAFVGCTVSPGFDFDDFELATAKKLIDLYPEHETIIKKMCRI